MAEKVKTRLKRKHADVQAFRELFVKEVQSNKDFLFGAFSPMLTDAMKTDKWEEIRLMMIGKGEKLLEGKDVKYVKTQYWQKIRADALERFDKGQTGAEANEKYKAVDEIVLDIVGKEVAEGLPEDDSIQALERTEQQISVIDEEQASTFTATPLAPKRRRKTFPASISAIDQAQIRKLDAESEMLKAQARLFNAQADQIVRSQQQPYQSEESEQEFY